MVIWGVENIMISLPALFVSKKHHFGLSVSRSSLRAVEVNGKGKVTSSVEVLLPEGTFNEGILVNREGLIQAIKSLLQKGKFSTNYVAVCFSEVYAYSREYTVPKLAQKDINEAISWNIKDLVPYPIEDIYFDWKSLSENDTEVKTIVVVVNKKILDPLIEVLTSVGLKPLSFEPGTSAIVRLLVLKPDQSVVIIEVNQKGAYVTLVDNSKALFTTVVNHPKDEDTQSYIRSILAAVNEIEVYYKQKGILKDKQFSVLLTGELANDEWASSISTASKYPVKILQTNQVPPSHNKAYAVGIGHVVPPLDDQSINLLPAHIQKKYDVERANAFYFSLLSRLIAVTTILLVLSLVAFVAVKFESQRLLERSVTLASKTQGQNSQMQKLLLLNGHSQQIVQLAPLRKTPSDKISALNSVLTEDIQVTQWEYDVVKHIFTINGIAKDRLALLGFKEKLENLDEFTKIYLPLGSLESPENIKFTLTFESK